MKNTMKNTCLVTATALLLSLIVFIFPIESSAMGDKPPADPECFESDELRLKLGNQRFHVNRQELSSFSPVDHEKYTGVTDKPESVCQKETDSDIEILGFFMTPSLLSCEGKNFDECKGQEVTIKFTGKRENTTYFPAKEDLTVKFKEECSARKYYTYFCRHRFDYANAMVTVQYHSYAYPLTDVEHTVSLLLQKLKEIYVNP